MSKEAEIVITILVLGTIGGAFLYYVTRINSNKNNSKSRLGTPETDKTKYVVDYDKLVDEIVEKKYPEFLSFRLYLKSRIYRLSEELTQKLNLKYGLQRNEPKLELDSYRWDSEFKRALKRRMEQEPEILKLIHPIDEITDFDNFLNKKAELEAERIIKELLQENPSNGGNNERA